jgi:hypothetical protein
MNADPGQWGKLPKFMYSAMNSNNERRRVERWEPIYVVHCHKPRFLISFSYQSDPGELFLIEPTEDQEQLAFLTELARDFHDRINQSQMGCFAAEV